MGARAWAAVGAASALSALVLVACQTWAALLTEPPRARDPSVAPPSALYFEPARWQHRYARLLAAARVEPWNAEHHHGLGQLHVWEALRLRPGSAESLTHWAEARHYYERALALRPTWALAHLQRAETVLPVSGADGAFSRSLAAAQRWGPWEADVHERGALLGMVLWDSLDEPSRTAVGALLRRASSEVRMGENLRRLAGRFGRQQVLERYLDAVSEAPEAESR